MARELILRISCVKCEVDIPADDPAYDVQVLLRVERLEGKLDLCKTCREELLERLAPYLDHLEDTMPRRTPQAGASSGRGRRMVAMRCPRCDMQVNGGPTPLRNHLKAHGMSKDAAVKEIPLGTAGVHYPEQYPQLAHLVIY